MNTLSPPSTERRSRASRPKVRTGCVTCKARRKKCDEARPYCHMCTSTGRECGGYHDTIDRRTRAARNRRAAVESSCIITKVDSRQKQLSLAKKCDSWISRLLIDPSQTDLSLSERWYLGFFRTDTSVQCAGYFPLEFWDRMVHQISEEEPAVRHAIIAISALHRSFGTKDSLALGQNDRNSFPLRQCNKAITLLRQRLQGGDYQQDSHVLTTLVTCVLFISFAFLQGDIYAASCHLRHGARLLQDSQFGSSKDVSCYGPALTDVFYHLELHWSSLKAPGMATLRHEHSLVYSMAIGNPVWSKPIHCLKDACNLLVGLAWLICENDPHDKEKDMAKEILDKHQGAILNKLQLWKTELGTSLAREQAALSSGDCHTLAALDLWTEIIYIRVSTDRKSADGESRFDPFRSNFQRAVQIAGSILGADFGHSPTPTFCVGMGMIPPLYLCAFRCRDWHIRREAVALLKKYNLQEGVWTSSGTAFVLERLIAIESEGLTPDDKVPEHVRIYSMRGNLLSDGSGLQLWYRRSRWGKLNENDRDDVWETEIMPFQT